MHYHINENAWEKIYEFLMTVKRIHCKNTESLRLFVEGVYYVLRTGCQWRMLPEYYGHWRAVHKRFMHWPVLWLWDEMMKHM
uniref:transposase n=1 Tax=Facilibium subflavum TaxID=2219058 RepID=UPI0013C32A94